MSELEGYLGSRDRTQYPTRQVIKFKSIHPRTQILGHLWPITGQCFVILRVWRSDPILRRRPGGIGPIGPLQSQTENSVSGFSGSFSDTPCDPEINGVFALLGVRSAFSP